MVRPFLRELRTPPSITGRRAFTMSIGCFGRNGNWGGFWRSQTVSGLRFRDEDCIWLEARPGLTCRKLGGL